MKTILLIIFLVMVLATVTGLFFKDTEIQESKNDTAITSSEAVKIPSFLRRSFPETDFSRTDKKIEQALSGGPGKDGIPALTNPNFELISDSKIKDSVQAIVLRNKEKVQVYPYNILTWHEIVNDTFGDIPVAVTFCPLCGSAIVFDRRVGDDMLEFGVSGALIDSNMVMYDRETESLWQQSTGVGLAGQSLDTRLEIVPMQLMTVGEVRQKYPLATILTENTGHLRNYDRNPYGGYDEDDSLLFFPVSDFGSTYSPKEIMVVFRIDDMPVAISLKKLDGEQLTTDVYGAQITLSKSDGEVNIVNSESMSIPFYFEMWFSFSAQHGKEALVL